MYKKFLRTSVCLAIVTFVIVGTTARQCRAGLLDEWPEELVEYLTYHHKIGACRIESDTNPYDPDPFVAPNKSILRWPEHNPRWNSMSSGLGYGGLMHLDNDTGRYSCFAFCDKCKEESERYDRFKKIEKDWMKEKEARDSVLKESAEEEAELRKELLRLQIKALKEGQPSGNIAIGAVNLNIGNSSFSSSSSSSSKK